VDGKKKSNTELGLGSEAFHQGGGGVGTLVAGRFLGMKGGKSRRRKAEREQDSPVRISGLSLGKREQHDDLRREGIETTN